MDSVKLSSKYSGMPKVIKICSIVVPILSILIIILALNMDPEIVGQRMIISENGIKKYDGIDLTMVGGVVGVIGIIASFIPIIAYFTNKNNSINVYADKIVIKHNKKNCELTYDDIEYCKMSKLKDSISIKANNFTATLLWMDNAKKIVSAINDKINKIRK